MARLRATTDDDLASTAPAELRDLPDGFWDEAEVVRPRSKEAISLRVDRDVLDWFRSGGPRYQSRINAVLRSYMEAMTRRGRSRRRKQEREE